MGRRQTQDAARAFLRAFARWVPIGGVVFVLNAMASASRTRDVEEIQKPTLGVCVTGQLCRLEIENKMNLFILPSTQTYDVHVHFELEDDKCKYTNYHDNSDDARAEKQLRSFSDIEAYFQRYEDELHITTTRTTTTMRRRGLSTSFAKAAYGDPVIQYRYMYDLNKLGRVNETARALNHWRQWKAYQSCKQAFAAVGDFDLYARLREDLLFYKIFVPPLVWLNQSEHDVWLPRCASWRGFNDKIAFVHPRASEQYFTGVLDTYEQHYDDLRCSQDHVSCRYVFQTNNPETFLLQALTFLKVRVERMDPEYLPTFTGRHVNGTVFCFDQYRRQLGRNLDCLPFKDRKIFKSPCHDFALSQEF